MTVYLYDNFLFLRQILTLMCQITSEGYFSGNFRSPGGSCQLWLAHPCTVVHRTGQDRRRLLWTPVHSFLLEPRLLRPKYMQRGTVAPPKPVLGCTPSRQEGPFFASVWERDWLRVPRTTNICRIFTLDCLWWLWSPRRRLRCLRFTLEGPQEDSRLLWGRQ